MHGRSPGGAGRGRDISLGDLSHTSPTTARALGTLLLAVLRRQMDAGAVPRREVCRVSA